MVHNLEVDGNTKILGDIHYTGDLYKNNVLFTGGNSDWVKTDNDLSYTAGKVSISKLHITETTGTSANASNGSIILDHENNGGASSILFRSKVNRGSDYGYIQYQDASVVGGGGESARLIIGTSNDGDDHIILNPSGRVGIGTTNPNERLSVSGNISASNDIHIRGGATGHSISCKGNMASGHSNSGRMGLYIRHDNNTQGISIGHAGIIANGTNSTQGIKITSKGTFTSFYGNGSTGYVGKYFGNNASGVVNGGTLNDTTIFANGSIHSSSWFGSSSDSRIKTNIQDLDDNEMLNKVLLLKPVKYSYLDKEKSDDLVYGFIAQDVREVMGDEGTKLMTEFIYDINEKAVVNNGVITFNGILEVGLNYKIFHKERADYIVIKIEEKITDTTYKISLELGETIDDGEIFIIGKRVDDFHSLNKSAIFTMGIGAIQELHRTITRQQTLIDNLLSRIEALEGV